jgi:gamma-glutamyltranspeptidase/glutathione hydrolase
MPALGDTLERLATEGPDFLTIGDGGSAMRACLGAAGHITPADLAHSAAQWREPLTATYRGRRVCVPGPPSAAGAMVLRMLAELQEGGELPRPLCVPHTRRIIEAMGRALDRLPDDFQGRLNDPDFLKGYLGSGYTTHVSAVDGHNNAVGITSSLGETAGVLVPETGIILNNFLGEADVNPPAHPRRPGERLLTMCCPTILDDADSLYMMGAGGSSRIRSAILHGVVYLSDHGMTAQEAVQAPRVHLDGGSLRVEVMDRPQGYREALTLDWPQLIPFERHGMYFGGLHVAGRRNDVFTGGGDPRRTGSWASTGRSIGVGEGPW